MLRVGVSLFSFGFIKLPAFNMFLKFCIKQMRKYKIQYFELPIWDTFSIEDAKQINKLLNTNVKCYSIHFPKQNSARDLLQKSSLLEGVIALRPSVAVFHPQKVSDLNEDFFKLSRFLENIECKLSVEFIAYNISLQKDFKKIDESVAITLDFYHCVNAGFSVEKIIERFSSSIVHVHLNDFSETLGKSLCPGEGELPIISYINMLQEQNYEGIYMLECKFESAAHFQKIMNAICDDVEL